MQWQRRHRRLYGSSTKRCCSRAACWSSHHSQPICLSRSATCHHALDATAVSDSHAGAARAPATGAITECDRSSCRAVGGSSRSSPGSSSGCSVSPKHVAAAAATTTGTPPTSTCAATAVATDGTAAVSADCCDACCPGLDGKFTASRECPERNHACCEFTTRYPVVQKLQKGQGRRWRHGRLETIRSSLLKARHRRLYQEN